MTSFTQEQKDALSAPLAASVVLQRQQAGRKLDYVEAWHAIAEANRIFGFDGWSRETVDMHCVSEKPVTIAKGKQNEKPGFSVSYVAKVRVRVGDLIREGTGAGHGIDADVGLAHESATKEAESDALKRSLMTFGNPFGLALYDKSRESVFDDSRQPSKVHVGSSKDVRGRKIYDILLSEMTAIKASVTLRAWGENHKAKVNELPPDWREEFKVAYRQRMLDLTHGERPVVTEAPVEDQTYQLLLETMEKTRDLSSFERDWADEIASLPMNLQTAIGSKLDQARIKG